MVSGMPKQVILVHRDHHRIGSDRPTSVQGYFHQEICSCTEPHGLRQQLQVITLWLCWALLLKLFSISFQHMSLMETTWHVTHYHRRALKADTTTILSVEPKMHLQPLFTAVAVLHKHNACFPKTCSPCVSSPESSATSSPHRSFCMLRLTHTLPSIRGFIAMLQSLWVVHCVQSVKYQYWNSGKPPRVDFILSSHCRASPQNLTDTKPPTLKFCQHRRCVQRFTSYWAMPFPSTMLPFDSLRQHCTSAC
jgi:hypothetical protein